MSTPLTPVSTRLGPAGLAKVDQLRARMQAAFPTLTVTRSEAVRALVETIDLEDVLRPGARPEGSQGPQEP